MVKAAIAIYNRTIIFFLLLFKSGRFNPDLFPGKGMFLSGCLFPFFFLLASCEKQTTPVTLPNPQLTLTVEDLAVTEAWLRLRAQETAAEQQIIVWRDSSEIYNLGGAIADTTLYDSVLLPAHDYTYRAELHKDGQKIVDTEPVNITTMDTTSHNFQWEIFEFGGVHGSSVLYDVAIVNENDIWAVGEIHTAETDTFDSLGNWIPPYNAMHWNGSEWELKRVNFYLCPNGTSPTPYPIKAVFAFSSDNIWFTRGGSIVHWDGSEFIHDCQINSVIDGSINEIWGTDSNGLYAVGYAGTIVYYTGQFWSPLISGTEVDL